jgi:hypothetical protein
MAAAVAGFTTTVRDVAAAEQDMKFWLEGRVTKGRMDQAAADAAWDRITFTTDLEPAVTTVDLVIEAATEKLDVKRTIFAELDRLAPAHAILATNSSTYGLQRPLNSAESFAAAPALGFHVVALPAQPGGHFPPPVQGLRFSAVSFRASTVASATVRAAGALDFQDGKSAGQPACPAHAGPCRPARPRIQRHAVRR